ncbi:HEAT repeat domain-containing protein [Dictyobacter formicarum]|uniref:Uncharacterized protein n=1 Tax=Dictyobacter formicarum TaxID=2778368 RepID=A0ABQ3VVK2_9CHLR|nr:HEAT repeat domain-containing protein [Dictyobacter formicarum]GHO89403.1 hypothetical protein KSZ_74090 [Dictyobacter formicarum]
MSLEHQGSVYEATALAVPFLLAILADPQTPDKREFIHFLAHIGCNGLYLNHRYQCLSTQHYSRMAKDADPISWREENALYEQLHEDTHRSFREGLSIFLLLLSDPDPVVRQEVAFLLAAFPEARAMLLPPLITQLRCEENEYVQCSLLLSLGYLLPPTPDAVQLLSLYMEQGETRLLQFIAANALCTLLKDQTPENAVHVMFEVFAHPDALQPSYEQLSPIWGSGWIHARALYYLSLLTSSPHRMLILERLIELFPTVDSPVDYDCADLLVRIAFYEKQFRFQPHSTFNDLDPLQQTVLRTLAAKEMPGGGTELNDYFGAETLACMDFPANRRGLKAFLETATCQ